MNTESIRNFSIDTGPRGVALLRIGTPDNSRNKLGAYFIDELRGFIEGLTEDFTLIESRDEIRAVVILSTLKNDFISGYDLDEILKFRYSDEGREASLRAQELMKKIEDSNIPIIAAINGGCLGIGLELVLASTYSVSTLDTHTIFGFPDIKLGLIPFAGSLGRLTTRVGYRKALDMVVGGEPVRSERAVSLGLIDEAVPKPLLEDVAVKRAIEIFNKELVPKRRTSTQVLKDYLFRSRVFQGMIFRGYESRSANDAIDDLPTVAMALEVFGVSASSVSRGLHAESLYFGELAVNSKVKENIRIENALENARRKNSSHTEVPGPEITKVTVVGDYGIAPIAASIALGGECEVRVVARDHIRAGAVLKETHRLLANMTANGNISATELRNKFDLITATTEYTGIRNAQVVLESVGNNLSEKLSVLEKVERISGPDTLYSTHVQAEPISKIRQSSKRPLNIMGIRFYRPIIDNPMLELVVNKESPEPILAMAEKFVSVLGKAAIRVADIPGFYTERLLVAFLNEAVHIVSEGVDATSVDDSALSLGFTHAPLSLLDNKGIDDYLDTAQLLSAVIGERFDPPPLLKELVGSDRLGKKSGEGFYLYSGGSKRIARRVAKLLPGKNTEPFISVEQIQHRLLYAIISEALASYELGIIESPLDGDLGAVYGLGFPKHMGGPFSYVDSLGASEVLKNLHNLGIAYKPRYQCPELIKQYAIDEKLFYAQ